MMKRKPLLLGLAISGLFAVIAIVAPVKAAAIVNNNQEIPPPIVDIMEGKNGVGGSDCRQSGNQYRYAQFSWVSPAGSSKVDSLSPSVGVSEGQDILGLWLNNLTAVCNNNINGSGDIIHKDKSVTRSRVTSAVAVADGNTGLIISNFLCGGENALNGSSQDLSYGSAYLFKLRYVVQAYPSYTPANTPFCLRGLAGLSKGYHTVVITTTVRTIHQGTDGDFKCVELAGGAVQAASSLDDTGCNTRTSSVTVNLIIGDDDDNEQPDARIDGISCAEGGLTGWAIDPDSPFTPTRVDFYDGPLGVGNGVGSARADRPHGANETLPYGNPNARFLLDFRTYPSLYRGTHTLYAYAIDTAGGPFRDLNPVPKQPGFGPITFTYTDVCGPDGIPSDVYNIVPKAAADLDDDENPQHAVFESGISSGAPADGTIVRRLYIRRGSVVETIPGTPGTENRRLDEFDYLPITIDNPQTALRFATLGNSPFSPGDEICIDVTVNPRQVRVYQDGVVQNTDNNPVTNTKCDRFVNKPFLSVYGGDVSAGGGFGTACSASNAGINTNNNAAQLGSGVEFAAQAVGVISGFSSARLTSPPKTLTFSNNTAALGNFAAGHCIKDYFSKAPANVTAGSEVFPGSLASGIVKYGSGAGSTTTLHSGNLGDGVRTSLYIDGDLVIDGAGIGYASGSWTDTKQIPSLHVYVAGNIWIQSSVLSLNGMFVAQPRSGVADSGRIITCASGSARVGRTDLFNVCGNKLLVNGALVADRVDFLRAGSSMRLADTGSEGSPSSSRGAEVINMSPEFIMVAPDADHKEILKKYQFFTTLPPVL